MALSCRDPNQIPMTEALVALEGLSEVRGSYTVGGED